METMGLTGPGSWAISGPNLVVIALILLFLLVPSALLLVDHARQARTHPTAASPAGAPRRRTVPAARAVALVERGTVPHDFWNETPPHVFGHVQPYTTVKGDLEHRGHLHLAAGVVVQGNVTVHGNLAMGSGVEIQGRLDVRGDAYVRTGTHVRKGGRILGDLYADRAYDVGLLTSRTVKLHDERHDAPLPSDVFGRAAGRPVPLLRENP